MRDTTIVAADIMRTQVVTVPATMALREIERLLAEHGIGGAPVTDHAGRIVGVVSLRDVADRHSEEPFAGGPPAHWSAAIGESGDRDSPTGEASDQLDATDRAERATAPAVETAPWTGEPAGEELELERMATGESVPVQSPETAGAVMTAEIHAVDADASLVECAAAMVDHAIHRVLVRKGGKIVGVVTSTDVLRAFARHGSRG